MIPRQIHQLWIAPAAGAGAVPGDVAAQVAEWKSTHPDFDHALWTMDGVLRALPADASAALAGMLGVCRFEAMHADLARLFLLYHRGGFWVDLRLRPLRQFIDDHLGAEVVLAEHFVSEFIPRPAGVFVNGFFGCRALNPFIGQCLRRASDNVARRLASTVWEVSGPKVFMDTREQVRRQSGQDLVGTILPSAAVWGRLIEIGSGSYAAGARHWSVREQHETMYLDTDSYADRVPVWRTRYLGAASTGGR